MCKKQITKKSNTSINTLAKWSFILSLAEPDFFKPWRYKILPVYYLMAKRKFLSFLFSLFILQACRQPTTPLTREEAVSVIDRFDEGWRNKNLELVDSVLSPDYIYFTQSGGTFSRDSVVATAGAPSYTLEKMSRSEIYIQISGNTAIASTRWKGKGVYRGTPFDEDQRCSIVIVKKGDKVEILSEHCTPIRRMILFH